MATSIVLFLPFCTIFRTAPAATQNEIGTVTINTVVSSSSSVVELRSFSSDHVKKNLLTLNIFPSMQFGAQCSLQYKTFDKRNLWGFLKTLLWLARRRHSYLSCCLLYVTHYYFPLFQRCHTISAKTQEILASVVRAAMAYVGKKNLEASTVTWV